MAVNKVVYGTTVLVDLTEDTVSADTLRIGNTAHDASGNLVYGNLHVQNVAPSGTIEHYINKNGTHVLDALGFEEGQYDAMEDVTVNVNIPTYSLQESKNLPIQGSGTITITPDDGYDAMKKVVATVYNATSLPTGFSKIATGTYTFSSDMTGNSSTTSTTYQKTIDHGLGVIPDIIYFFSEENVAQTYSMLGMAWGNTMMNWRGSTYKCNVWYHGNSTTTVGGTSCNATYGIRNVTSSQFSIKTYSNSTSYFWRAGTYKWIAIKF